MQRRSEASDLPRVVPANAGTHTPCPLDKAPEQMPSLTTHARALWVPAFAGTTRVNVFTRGRSSQSLNRQLAIFAVGKARLFQIEIAFDPPPDLVGDLAVA